MSHGVVYTETVVYSPPEKYAAEAPYQLAIVDLKDGSRSTVRIVGERVKIGDAVILVEERAGVHYFEKGSG